MRHTVIDSPVHGIEHGKGSVMEKRCWGIEVCSWGTQAVVFLNAIVWWCGKGCLLQGGEDKIVVLS